MSVGMTGRRMTGRHRRTGTASHSNKRQDDIYVLV